MADMKKEVKIQFDYLNGPIWKDKVNANTGKLITGIPCIDNDQEIALYNARSSQSPSDLTALPLF